MNFEKKKRTANFTTNDRSTLINIVAKYRQIIENKRTDAVTVEEKKKTWLKITKEFNSCAPSCPRDMETLKRCYENKKKHLRKSAAIDRRQLYQTGGGLPNITEKKDPDDELLLGIICSKSIHGLEHRFGGDAMELTASSSTTILPETQIESEDNIEFIYEADEELNTELQEIHSNVMSNSEENVLKNNIISQDQSCTSESMWKKYKSADLKLPLSKELQGTPRTKMNASPSTNESTSKKRPRTVVKSLTTSDIGVKYNKLLDVRLEIADFQKQQILNAMRNESVEHNLRVELLKAKINSLKNV